MLGLSRRSAVCATAVSSLLALSLGACFVSLDEALIDQAQQQTETDASTDATEADAKEEAATDKDAAHHDTGTDAGLDAHDDASDAEQDADEPDVLDTDAADDGATEDSGEPDAETDAPEDALDARDEAEAGEPDVIDIDVQADVTDDVDTDAEDPEAGDPDADDPDADDPDADDPDAEAPDGDVPDAAFDAPDDVVDADIGDVPLLECYDDTWCAPVGCMLRTCDQGRCVNAGPMRELAGTFVLPEAPSCVQSVAETCVVAQRNYLVALTESGFTVVNFRNPAAPRLEMVPNNIGPDWGHLVRSGSRVFAFAHDGRVAWLDLPLDGVSPLTAPRTQSLSMPVVDGALPIATDSVLLYTSNPRFEFGRWTPGQLPLIATYPATDAVETMPVATSGSRVLLYDTVQFSTTPTVTWRHHFSLQTNVTSSTSANGGTTELATFTNGSGTQGFFAQSRTGAVAWIVARFDETNSQWKETWAFWILTGQNAPLDFVNEKSLQLENYQASPPTASPQGPVAFIDADTIASVIMQGITPPAPGLTIARQVGDATPQRVKRIPVPDLPLLGTSIAGDNGFAYTVHLTDARMFAHSCSN